MADVLTIILLVIFLATSILIGYFASRKEDSEGYLIANRKLGIFQSVMTISGSFIGAMTLLVYTAFVFTYGISAIWIFIGYLIGFVIFTFFALHLKDYSKGKKFYTPADYFTHRFDRKTALYVMIAIFIFYFGALIAQFVGSGKILTEITGMNYSVSVIVIFVVIMSYLLMGGFKSVVKTDVFQFSILGILLLVIGYTIRGGLQVPVTHFNIFNASPIMITAFLVLGIFTLFAGQDFWQRVYAMKNRNVVKKSFIISGVIVFIVALVLTYIGLVAKTHYASIDADIAILYSFTRLVPSFMVGIVAIAFFAAILSSADTILFVLGVNLAKDFLKKKDVRYTRISILIIGILAVLLALVFKSLVDIAIVFKSIGLIVSVVIFFTWITKGNRTAIKVTIGVSTVAILIIAFFGFLSPELAVVSIFATALIYWLVILFLKLFKKKEKN